MTNSLLEVVEENLPALRTYKAVGFTVLRSLDCLKGYITSDGSIEELEIQELQRPLWTYHG